MYKKQFTTWVFSSPSQYHHKRGCLHYLVPDKRYPIIFPTNLIKFITRSLFPFNWFGQLRILFTVIYKQNDLNITLLCLQEIFDVSSKFPTNLTEFIAASSLHFRLIGFVN